MTMTAGRGDRAFDPAQAGVDAARLVVCRNDDADHASVQVEVVARHHSFSRVATERASADQPDNRKSSSA